MEDAPGSSRGPGRDERAPASRSGVWATRTGQPADTRPRSIGERMSRLAESLPCLAGKPGVRPWDAERLDDWASAAGRPPAELHAARFVLNVWDAPRPWRCGRFNFLDALDHWDPRSRATYAAWALDPWWPFFERGSDIDLADEA